MTGTSKNSPAGNRNFAAAVAHAAVANATPEEVNKIVKVCRQRAADQGANRLLEGWTDKAKIVLAKSSPKQAREIVRRCQANVSQATPADPANPVHEQIVLAAQSEDGFQALIQACRESPGAATKPWLLESDSPAS